MGSTCSTKKNIILKSGRTDKDEIVSATFYNTIPKHKKFNSQFELFLKLIELIDIHRRYSNELLADLNVLINFRAKIIWLCKHNPAQVKSTLVKCVQIVNNLRFNKEFECYFPMLSVSLIEQSFEIEKYIREKSNESTNLNSLNEFKFDDSDN